MKKIIAFIPLFAAIFLLFTGQSVARTLESDLTYPLMDEYCESISQLASRAYRFKKRGLDDDAVVTQAVDFIGERNHWSGRLAARIESETIALAMRGADADHSASIVMRMALDNCMRKILFYKEQ